MPLSQTIRAYFRYKQENSLIDSPSVPASSRPHLEEHVRNYMVCRKKIQAKRWRCFLRAITPKVTYNRSKSEIIKVMKTCLFRFEIYAPALYEECLYYLSEYLREHRNYDELLYIYTTSTHFFRRHRDIEKLFLHYHYIIDILEKRLTYDNRNLIAKYYSDMALIHMSECDDIATAIENLMMARTHYKDSNTPSGIQKTHFQMACLYILSDRYSVAVDICEAILFPHIEDVIRPVMRDDIAFICVYILALIVELGSEPATLPATLPAPHPPKKRIHPRVILRRIKNSYLGIDDYDHYMFLLNILSSVEGVNIDHFNHEVSKYTGLHGRLYPDDRVYHRIITDIRRKIMRERCEKEKN